MPPRLKESGRPSKMTTLSARDASGLQGTQPDPSHSTRHSSVRDAIPVQDVGASPLTLMSLDLYRRQLLDLPHWSSLRIEQWQRDVKLCSGRQQQRRGLSPTRSSRALGRATSGSTSSVRRTAHLPLPLSYARASLVCEAIGRAMQGGVRS